MNVAILDGRGDIQFANRAWREFETDGDPEPASAGVGANYFAATDTAGDPYAARAVAGIRYLPADCRFPVLLAAVLYADYHRAIRARDCDVLSAEPSLGTARKLSLLARTRWHWAWNSDPEAVFRRASAVPDPGEGHPGPTPGSTAPTR